MANANNQNGDSELRNRKPANNTDDNVNGNGNYEMLQGNIYNPNQQMMGWMPPPPPPNPYYGMGWMPQPGMPAYPPPNHNYGMGGMQPNPYHNPHPQYGMGGMGWMPQPGMQQPMQQPMMMLPPPVFNNRGFAPSHNGNIQDIAQINELNGENKGAANNIKDNAAVAATTKATKNARADDDADNDADNDVNIVNIPEPKNNKQDMKANNKVYVPRKAKQEQKQDRQLAELFDNALDDNMQEAQPQEANQAEFGQEPDESNVITKLTPDNKHHAHFDNARFPNEMYNAVMVNGDTTKLPAKDISPDALETGKIVYEHNNQLSASGQPSAGKAFIYVRSSRTNDISIETQRKVCLQYAATNNLELLPFGYQNDNNISARNMGNLKHELGFWQDYIPVGSHIIIYSVDRLSRHLVKGMQFLDLMTARDIRIHFVTHELVFHSDISAAGRAMIQQELQSAEKFSNIASEKVRTTMARLKQEGHVFGRAPYGYKHTKIGNIRKRTPDNKEQQNIREIQSQYSYIMDNWKNNPDTAGLRYSKINMLRTIIRWCNRNGLKYRNHKNYTASQIRNIIQIEVNNN
jgi:DNA invertase Pin-like site-specific DNA recombinase